jgi:hypothetical protein
MRRIVCLMLGWFAVAARAEPPRGIDGTIVKIDGDLVYIDVGQARGLRGGLVIQVLRTVEAQHPVTNEKLVDHFPIGAMNIIEAGPVLSYGRVEPRIAGQIKLGDVVRLAQNPPPPSPSQPATTSPTQRSQPALELSRIWTLTLGHPPGERAQILTEYLRAHPDSPYVSSLEREIAAFTALDARLREAAQITEQKTVVQKRAHDLEIRGTLPERLYDGDPFEVAILVNHPDRVDKSFVYVRRPETITYERIPLVPDGDGYFRGRVPRAVVAPPALELFVEVVERDGRVVTEGDESHPRHVEIDALPTPVASEGPGHSAIRGFFQFVDFNRFRGNDYYLLAESDFTYRIAEIFYAVRTGFGVLSGKSGTVAELDARDPSHDKTLTAFVPCDPKDPTDKTCGHDVGFNYGYIEAELHFGRYFGMAGRFLGGHTMNGTGVGAELRLRIGNERGTNLQIGGSILSDIGALALVALEWDVIHGWPMSVGFSVTNQPSGGDLGFTLAYMIGYRAKPWLQPSLRIGYDARTIDHAGLSLGLGLVMAW